MRLLGPAMRQAARVARGLEGRVENRPKAGEANAVKAALTLADAATQEALLGPLFEHFPHVRLEAEEATPHAERFPRAAPELVVLDPIDGTLHFYLEGAGPYGVLLGLAQGRRYQAGLVALPREGLFLDAVRGGAARRSREDAQPEPARVEADGRRVLVSHDMPAAVQERLRERGYEVGFGCGGAISVAPLLPGVCAGLRLVGTSTGISQQGRIGVLISRTAGARVEAAGGRSFPEELDAREPALVVACDPDQARDLQWALEAA